MKGNTSRGIYAYVLPGVIERPSERAIHIRQLGDGKTTPYGLLDRGADTCFNHPVLQIDRTPNMPQGG